MFELCWNIKKGLDTKLEVDYCLSIELGIIVRN